MYQKSFTFIEMNVIPREAWLAKSVHHVTPDLRFMLSSPTFDVELKKTQKYRIDRQKFLLNKNCFSFCLFWVFFLNSYIL